MSGFAFQGLCYPALGDAQVAQCTGSYPAGTADGGVISCVAVVSGGLQLQRTDANGAGAPYTVAVVYADCDSSAFAGSIPPDSAALGFAWGFGFSGVLICYLTAWACARVLEQIRG